MSVAVNFLLVSYLLVWSGASAGPLWNLVHDLVQSNIAGIPTIHEKSTWNFDPDAGKQKRAHYEQQNGRFGETAIARLGLGYES
ncbi:uncharacterized protein LOC100680177 [Nasonia vitripennis]|uniref:Uncharacterized protein n=1 Tax=Nasonia vitripennis TaxID=7425 RepID=A0A7M7GDT6_NASVI|nr:uncharacterized protein LOC100680177 [Nasonia vitripennis]